MLQEWVVAQEQEFLADVINSSKASVRYENTSPSSSLTTCHAAMRVGIPWARLSAAVRRRLVCFRASEPGQLSQRLADVQTHPAFYPLDTRLSPRGLSGWGAKLTTHLHLLQSRYMPWWRLGGSGGIAPTHSWPRH